MKLNLSTYKPFAVLNTVSYRMIDWNSPVNCVNTPKDAFSSICYLTFVLMPFQTMYCKLGLLLQFPCICMKTDFNDWQLLLQTRKILTFWSTLIIMLQHLGELKKKIKKNCEELKMWGMYRWVLSERNDWSSNRNVCHSRLSLNQKRFVFEIMFSHTQRVLLVLFVEMKRIGRFIWSCKMKDTKKKKKDKRILWYLQQYPHFLSNPFFKYFLLVFHHLYLISTL